MGYTLILQCGTGTLKLPCDDGCATGNKYALKIEEIIIKMVNQKQANKKGLPC